MSCTLVTVTYGRRAHLLREVLIRARQEGIEQAVVVDNGSEEDVKDALGNTLLGWADVVRLEKNSGSASGFKVGIRQAISKGTSHILLLDDDNLIEPGALSALASTWASASLDADRKATVAVRQGHGQKGRQHLRGSFCQFNILDVPSKLTPARRLARNNSSISQGPWTVDTAPYGGLYFHRTLIDRIGLPNELFYLYQDDTDFTYRITASGGEIRVCPDASITDIDISWHNSKRRLFHFLAWVSDGSPRQVYYTMRNNAYWDYHIRKERGPLYYLNAISYLVILLTACLLVGRIRRAKLILTALADAFHARMGANSAYPLA